MIHAKEARDMVKNSQLYQDIINKIDSEIRDGINEYKCKVEIIKEWPPDFDSLLDKELTNLGFSVQFYDSIRDYPIMEVSWY